MNKCFFTGAKIIFLNALAIVFASKAFALSGEELAHYCSTNACGGYFVGAFDGVRIAGAVGTEKQRKHAMICAPDDVSDEQIADVALRYLQQHNEAWHLSAANLALRAWREKWPCRQ